MIQKIDMYACVCDRCGKRHENENLGYMAWGDGGQAFEDAEEAGWTEIDGKHYCLIAMNMMKKQRSIYQNKRRTNNE